MLGTIRASSKLLAFVIFCILMVPFQYLVRLFASGAAIYVLPRLWHRVICCIFSIKVVVKGTPLLTGRTIYVSNHISYLDIPVIGSILKASFVAKEDVASWPVFGLLSKLQNTAFVSRRRDSVSKEKNNIISMIDNGGNIIIFPEGTSTEGVEVIPFKSSLFAIAIQKHRADITIQPFTVRMISIDKKQPDTQSIRDIYSWHRNMDTPLFNHLWQFAKTRGAVISLNFHTPLRAHDFSDRKALALACHEAVSGGLTSKP